MSLAIDLSAAERRLIATLSRLDDSQSLVLDNESDMRVAHALRQGGIVQGADDEDEGFRLTTIGRTLAEAVN